MTPAPKRVVVAGGRGAMGSLFADRLEAEGCAVTRVDPLDGDMTDDITTPGPSTVHALAEADVVVLAVDEDVTLRALPVVHEAVDAGTLVIDTTSVKMDVVAAHRRHRRGPVLSVNPMFGPGLDPAGRAIACVTVEDGPAAADFRDRMTGWGADVVPMSAQGHDELTALTQVLTHASLMAFGVALASLLENTPDVDVETVWRAAPPPHRTLLQLVARLVGLRLETYRDIQTSRCGPRARAALGEALGRVEAAGSAEATRLLFREVQLALGPVSAPARAACQAMFERCAHDRHAPAGAVPVPDERYLEMPQSPSPANREDNERNRS